jgi:hypothetical protein
MNRRVARSNLLDICRTLESRNIQHWLTDGTLLGLMRNGSLLRHDGDTDLGVLASSFDPDVLDELELMGFTLEHYAGSPAEGMEITFSRADVRTDLFFFYATEKDIFHSAYWRFNESESTAERLDYHYQPFKIGKFLWHGNAFPIPDQPESYLEQKYGIEWRVPQRNWDYALDPFNVRETGRIVRVSQARPQVKELAKLFLRPGVETGHPD